MDRFIKAFVVLAGLTLAILAATTLLAHAFSEQKNARTGQFAIDTERLPDVSGSTTASRFAQPQVDELITRRPQASALLDNDFDDDTGGFVYNDDVFRGTTEPYYSWGKYLTGNQCDSGGCLKVSLGGKDDKDILGMSGGWTTSFNQTTPSNVVLTLRYRIRQLRDYEPNEYTEALVSFDGELVDLAGKDYLGRIRGDGNGGSNIDTGWRSATINLGTVSAGSHTLTVGGRNNKKTARREYSSVWFDSISLSNDLVGADTPGSITFGVLGDFGTGSAQQDDVTAEMETWDMDFIITVGDNRYGNRTLDSVVGKFYCRYLTEVDGGSNCPAGESDVNAFFPSLGNHDYGDGGGLEEYLDYFTLPGANVLSTGTSGTELYYDFIQGPVHFFAVDSEGASIPDQRQWLQAGLASSTSPWKVVFFHHPPFSSSSYHGSHPRMQWPFAEWGADAVLSGHDHTYERIERGGVLYFVNGLGGRNFYDIGQRVTGSRLRYNRDHGAQRVTATPTRITFEFVTRTGEIVDSRTISR